MPNTHKREEICKRLALDLTFYMEETKVEPENISPVFAASFCSTVYYFPVFPEKFLKTDIFPVFQSFQQEWTPWGLKKRINALKLTEYFCEILEIVPKK